MGSSQVSASRLAIDTLTWTKFSYNLFDYESLEYSRTNLKIEGEGFLIRRGFDIDFTSTPKQLDEVLLRVYIGKSGKYVVERSDAQGNDLDVWRVLKPEEEIMVNENDILQVGRAEVKIKKLDLTTLPEVRGIIQQCGKARPESECRFCFTQENQITNPLLSTCECKGSLQYIHLECLRVWLHTRMHKREYDATLCYCWDNLKCELCGSLIRSSIDLFILEQPEEPSILIETTENLEEDKKVSVFVLGLDKASEIGIGRGKGNQIRLSDISASRNHCKLYVREGRAYLKDNGSKFGTLVGLQPSMEIKFHEELWVQVGRTLIKLACTSNS